MLQHLRERFNILTVKRPARTILIGILLFNLLLLFASALVIHGMSPSEIRAQGFGASIFFTISMILDAGCIQYVIADIGKAGVGLVIVCMSTVLIGMITFTGAVIGYLTNTISSYIDHANSGVRPIRVTGHTVILNWNTRASEIVNDLLYSGEREIIIILVEGGAVTIQREIDYRIAATVKSEQDEIYAASADMPLLRRAIYRWQNRFTNKLDVIVREGDSYSTKQLNDISISQAKSIILLSQSINSSTCGFSNTERKEAREKGNSCTVKTLVQVAQLTADTNSMDNQVIIVEIEDDWTMQLVSRIIEHKERAGKCNIIPVPVNKILGQILSQFSVMPELNTIYSDLFSYKGVEFCCEKIGMDIDEEAFIQNCFEKQCCAIPMALMKTKTGRHAFYVAEKEDDIGRNVPFVQSNQCNAKLNPAFWFKQKNVVIIGHNSKNADLMNGFDSFRAEWNRNGFEILNVLIIDDEDNLKKHDYYKNYSYVSQTVSADIYDSSSICNALSKFICETRGNVCILILSDDSSAEQDIDTSALTYLIYAHDVVCAELENDPQFARSSIDIVVEILNPKNYDVVRNYSVNNIVISNRYISRMLTQISRKEALYEFYQDLLTYDEAGVDTFTSKELYVKTAGQFFSVLPGKCSAAELIRSTYSVSPNDNKSLIIGCIKEDGSKIMFAGDLNELMVTLSENDKLILFSNH